MKTFQQFITEVYDKDLSTATRKPGEGGRVRTSRKKTDSEIRRVKAVGGGKTAPAANYKPRKDIGKQRPKGRASERQQQPTQARGSAALSAREAQRKAAQERRAAKSGGQSKDQLKKQADKLLTKKTNTVDPNYKPRKASGLTTKERKALYKKGERALRDEILKNTGKKSEKELKHKITSK